MPPIPKLKASKKKTTTKGSKKGTKSAYDSVEHRRVHSFSPELKEAAHECWLSDGRKQELHDEMDALPELPKNRAICEFDLSLFRPLSLPLPRFVPYSLATVSFF
jgi:hypothetical protein